MVMDLFSDFRDGSRLLDLLEVMSGQRVVSLLSVQIRTSNLTADSSTNQPSDCLLVFCRVGRKAEGCFSTGATLRRPSPS